MEQTPPELRQALQAQCAVGVSQVVRARRQEDYEALLEYLAPDPTIDPEARAKALYAIGRWGDPTPIPAIRALLPQLDETGRISAVDALGRLGGLGAAEEGVAAATPTPEPLAAEARAGIDEVLNDPSPRVRLVAAKYTGA